MYHIFSQILLKSFFFNYYLFLLLLKRIIEINSNNLILEF